MIKREVDKNTLIIHTGAIIITKNTLIMHKGAIIIYRCSQSAY